MDTERNETLYFRYWRSIDGQLVHLDTAKRNGRVVPRFSPSDFDPDTAEEEAGDLGELITELTYNLTEIERRTWLC